jgi:hypothetical protein
LTASSYFDRRPSDVFYALFYLGLFAEARGEATKAEHYMLQAVATPYAVGTLGRGDYMSTVARVRYVRSEICVCRVDVRVVQYAQAFS